MWSRGKHEHSWPVLRLQAPRLSRYTFQDEPSGVTGEFYMILEGPARGEIQGRVGVGTMDLKPHLFLTGDMMSGIGGTTLTVRPIAKVTRRTG
jgi:hypothetical protein